MATVLNLGVPDVAQYGGSVTGAEDEKRRVQGVSDQNNNLQRQASDAGSYANQQGSVSRGPTAVENSALAGNEASGANGHQQGAIGLAQSLAMGNGPSASAYQLQSGLNQATGYQTAAGRSGRGAAALATGQSNAMANNSALQQNAYTQAGALRAQDMAAGRGLYGSLTGQEREQDNARIGLANDLGQNNAQRNDAYNLGMGNAAVNFGNVGNQLEGQDVAAYGMGMQPIYEQEQGYQQGQGWKSDANKQGAAINKGG